VIIILSDSIFSSDNPEIGIELTVLIANSRHVVMADVDTPAFREWTESAGLFGLRLLQMIEASANFIRAGVIQTRLYIHSGISDWTLQYPKISVKDALSYIPIPFKIFVENNEADRAFLLAFLDKAEREELLEMQMQHWLVFVHGGGTGDLQKQISWEAANTMRADLRTFAYFDNDGLVPRSPSVKSLQIAAECQAHSIHFHQLSRRAIENYIPVSALEIWATLQKAKRRSYIRRQLAPFKKLSDDERDHFNMKSGPGADFGVVAYPGLSEYELRQLKKGFGKKVATVFQHVGFREKLSRDDFRRASTEVNEMYSHLRTRI
jgi:hypothetical protein